jgi:hypothetical protein
VEITGSERATNRARNASGEHEKGSALVRIDIRARSSNTPKAVWPQFVHSQSSAFCSLPGLRSGSGMWQISHSLDDESGSMLIGQHSIC